MSAKEEFLKIKTYEEFDLNRHKFAKLDINDPEVREHLDVIFPPLKSTGYENGVIYDVFKKKQ